MTKEQKNQLKLVSIIGELTGALSGCNYWINNEAVKKVNDELINRARKITIDVIDDTYVCEDLTTLENNPSKLNEHFNDNGRTYDINDPNIQKALKDFGDGKIKIGTIYPDPDMLNFVNE